MDDGLKQAATFLEGQMANWLANGVEWCDRTPADAKVALYHELQKPQAEAVLNVVGKLATIGLVAITLASYYTQQEGPK